MTNQIKIIYKRAKELYCDATMFVFQFFIAYLPKKMETEKWPKAADSPLPLEKVNLFLLFFCVLRSILTMEHYIKLLTIFMWKFALSCPVKFGTTCPSVIFLLATGSRPPCLRYVYCWLAHVFGKRTPFEMV